MVTPTRLAQVAVFALFIFCLSPSPAAAQKNSPERKSSDPTAQTTAKPDTPPSSVNKDPLFKGMKYRLVGPFRGGRSLTASGVPGDPTTYYFGGTGSGVWKSTDGALTWTSLFDKEGSSSIGSLAVAVTNPNIVYAGTGEACLRGNLLQDLEKRRVTRLKSHWQSDRQPDESRHCFRGCLGASLRTECRARDLPYAGWWQDLGKGPL